LFLQGGYTGQKFQELIGKEGFDFVSFPTAGDTRENFIAVDESTNLQYRFGMEGPQVSEAEWQPCLDYLEKESDLDYIVASGSLPPGVPLDFFGRLAALAKRKSAKLIVDTSGEPLKHAVAEGIYLCKPNLGELSSLSGKQRLAPDEIVPAARAIIAKGGCTVIAVSMGAEGAILVTAEESIRVKTPKVEVHSTVGAGDSMVAGMILGMAQGWSWKDTLSYGVAAGTSATMNHGTGLCKKEEVERIFLQLQKE
jgi:6-phosphofructokinase 2